MKNIPSAFGELTWHFKRWSRFWPYWLMTVLTYPWLVFCLICRRRKPLSKPLNVLVIPQTNRLGDLVCASPVFRAIKENLSDARVTVLVSRSKSAWQIIANNPRVDRVLFYEDANLIKVLRQQRFDYSLALTTYSLPSLLSFLACIPRRVKTVAWPKTWSECLSDWLNTDCVEFRHHTSLPRHYLSLLTKLGVIDGRVRPEVFLTPAGEVRAQTFLKQLHIKSGSLVVGISLSAGNTIKEWGDDRFGELAKRLADNFGAVVIFLGAGGDRIRIKELLEHYPSYQFFMATDFGLEELPSLINIFGLYIAVDTGPIYVAYALDVPVVDIIGPVDPTEQPPIDEKSLLIIPPTPIGPSSFVFLSPGTKSSHQRAVNAITVDFAYSQIQSFLFRLGYQASVSNK